MEGTALRILLVSGFFPPHAPMGAVRPGKLAEYWRNAGHDVRTIAIDLPSQKKAGEPSHPLVQYVPYEEPGKIVTKVKAAVVRSPVWQLVSTKLRQPRSRVIPSQSPAAAQNASIRKLGFIDFYRQALSVPDKYRSWIKPATQLALSWQDRWQPDVIYSSGPPHSSHMVAADLSTRLRIPWVAELRDLWVGDPYFDRHTLLKPMHDRLALRTLSRAAACVVVTDEARARLGEIFKKPILLSYNGYDAGEFAGLDDVQPFDKERLTIVHAGVIYPGRRDPAPLFRAISSLGKQGRKIRCLFYSDTHGSVAALAEQYGVRESVEIRVEIPRAQILRLERQVDILLECRWQDRAGDGVIPGKLFEYIGARRPILSVGSLTGEAADIVRNDNFGLVSNDPDEIKAMLIECLKLKEQLGRLPDRIGCTDDRFRRETQFQKLNGLFEEILATTATET
jgi:hypothetical protein